MQHFYTFSLFKKKCSKKTLFYAKYTERNRKKVYQKDTFYNFALLNRRYFEKFNTKFILL